MLLRNAINERLSEDHWDLANELADEVCDTFDSGGDDQAISDAVARQVDALLQKAESTLTDAEKIIRGGT